MGGERDYMELRVEEKWLGMGGGEGDESGGAGPRPDGLTYLNYVTS